MPTFLQNELIWQGLLIATGVLAFALAASVVARYRMTMLDSEECGDSSDAVEEEEAKPQSQLEPNLRPNKDCFQGPAQLPRHLTRTVRMACADLTTSTKKLFRVIVGPKSTEKS